MDIRPIKSEEDYEEALAEIESLSGAEPDTPEGEKLEVLTVLVSAYEEEHYPIPLPDPIEAIQYHMPRLGLENKDLEPSIGSRSRVWETLNRKRGLTLAMIRRLSAGLDIPLEILVQDYELDVARKASVENQSGMVYHELGLGFTYNADVGDALEILGDVFYRWFENTDGKRVVRVVVTSTTQTVVEGSPVETAQGSNSYSEVE